MPLVPGGVPGAVGELRGGRTVIVGEHGPENGTLKTPAPQFLLLVAQIACFIITFEVWRSSVGSQRFVNLNIHLLNTGAFYKVLKIHILAC